jgi:AcrR family transcriptional regulator
MATVSYSNTVIISMSDNNHCLTMQRILDSAEHLFAENGYRGTSLRMITSEAKVNLAAVNYHFGSKEELARQIFERKMVPLNRIRIENIERVLSESWENGQQPTVKTIMQAFIEPAFEMMLGDQRKSFIALIVRSMAVTDSTLNCLFMESVQTVLKVLHEALCRALPDKDPQEVLFKLIAAMTTMGGMLMRISSDTAFRLPVGQRVKDDLRQWAINEDNLIKFITAGMEAE